jgi:hypothetical protein
MKCLHSEEILVKTNKIKKERVFNQQMLTKIGHVCHSAISFDLLLKINSNILSIDNIA